MAKRRKGKRPKTDIPRLLREVRLYLFAFFVFSLPLFFLPGNSEYGYTKSIYALCFVPLLYLLWGAEGLLRRRWDIDLTWGTPILLAFMAVSLISLLGGTPAGVVIQSAVLVLVFGLAGILAADLIRGERELGIVLAALLASGVGNALFGLLQYFGAVPGGSLGGGVNAVIATMGNRNFLGGFLAYIFFPCSILVVLSDRHWKRALSVLGLGFILFVALFVRQAGVRVGLSAAWILLSFSAGYWGVPRLGKQGLLWLAVWVLSMAVPVGIVVGPVGIVGYVLSLFLGAAAFSLGGLLRRRPLAWVPTMIVALAAVLLLNPATTPFAAVERAWERNAGRVRAWDWWVGYFMWKDHPLTGVGLGGYKIHFVPYKPEFLASPLGRRYRFPIARAAQAHNEYVQVAAELGSLGILVLLGGLALIAYVWVRRMGEARGGTKAMELAFLGAGPATTLAHALVSFPWHLPASSLAFVVALGAILSKRYGRIGSMPVSLGGNALRVALAFLVVAGLGLGVVAVRDLIADRYLFYGKLALYRGDVHTARRLLEKAVSMDFFPRLSLYWLGVAKMQLGLYSEALEIFEKCLHRYTPEPLFLHIAMLNLKLGKPEEARRYAEFLLSTYPRRALQDEAQFIVAQSYYAQGELGEAKEVLEELLSRSPNFEKALITLGEIAQSTGDFEGARSYYGRALRVIEGKIKRLERKLVRPLSAEEFASVRTDLENLKQLKRLIEERLSKLP